VDQPWTNTTPDPELFGKRSKKDKGPNETVTQGPAPKEQAADCPNDPTNPNQVNAPQQPGGGGAPGTGG